MLEDLALSLNKTLYIEPYSLYIHKLHAKKHVLPKKYINMYIFIQFTIHETLHWTILHLYVHLYTTKTKALSDYKCNLICTRDINVYACMKEK